MGRNRAGAKSTMRRGRGEVSWLMVLLELQQIQLNHSSEIPKIHLGNQIYLCLSEYALKI